MRDGFETPTGRFTGEQSRHLDSTICELVSDGHKTGEIAKRLNLPYSLIGGRIFRLRDAGKIPLFQTLNPYAVASHVLQLNGNRIGTMERLFKAIGADAAKWVAESTPKGSTAAEFIAAIIRDAYAEETEEIE